MHRKYPLRQPKNYRPPVPRWQLQLPAGTDRVFTIYIGVQCHASDASTLAAASDARASIAQLLRSTSASPSAHETFTFLSGSDEPGSPIWACYFTSAHAYAASVKALSLAALHASLPAPSRPLVGLWLERFSTAVSRLETNYSGLDYLPGLARVPGAEAVEHAYSAYWGAARDRIPDSAHDAFSAAPSDDGDAVASPPLDEEVPAGLGQRLTGANYENMVHIRSGQFWEACGDEEAAAYEGELEPALMEGLRYLWGNPHETGTLGLRFMRNDGGKGEAAVAGERRETCAAGFFRSLGDLEAWAERHPSHKAIYLGAIRHAKTFGAGRRMRTWHEVSVLKAGEARFEYVNCTPGTGVIRFVGLDVEGL